MEKVALWKILDGHPAKLARGSIDLEKNLEIWIEEHPNLIQTDLRIIGRQVSVEGGRIDLLALDPLGRWIVIEIKPGPISSETIGQVMYYASSISKMPYEILKNKINDYLGQKGTQLDSLLQAMQVDERELSSQKEREVLMMLVGTGSSNGLISTVQHFSQKLPIKIISFDVFDLDKGNRILVRELTESDYLEDKSGNKRKQQVSIEAIFSVADESGIGPAFRQIYEVATKNGLFARVYPGSIMYTPPQRHDRMVLTVWAQKKSKIYIRTYVSPEAFAEFFPVSEDKAISLLGPEGWQYLTEDDVKNFIDKLNSFFKLLEATNTQLE